ncbi:hypothetical protein [Nostoc sp.]|uniref:hypothetical protein n=1 Tax=Nostoc sp. TaxID=1180 RepID=UPI002FF448C7
MIACKTPACDRSFLPLCSLRLCSSLKRVIACKICTVRSPLLPLRLGGSLKKAIAPPNFH